MWPRGFSTITRLWETIRIHDGLPTDHYKMNPFSRSLRNNQWLRRILNISRSKSKETWLTNQTRSDLPMKCRIAWWFENQHLAVAISNGKHSLQRLHEFYQRDPSTPRLSNQIDHIIRKMNSTNETWSIFTKTCEICRLGVGWVIFKHQKHYRHHRQDYRHFTAITATLPPMYKIIPPNYTRPIIRTI